MNVKLIKIEEMRFTLPHHHRTSTKKQTLQKNFSESNVSNDNIQLFIPEVENSIIITTHNRHSIHDKHII